MKNEKITTPKSGLDLWKLMGGETQRVKPVEGMPAPDSLLAVYQDRFTYTFILENEVASIHYDKKRNEIFFKGHNIKNFELNPAQIQALVGLKTILTQDKRAKGLVSDYEATLHRVLADNINGRGVK
ncbi:MAG: hypothetical protein A3H42_03410 [Deltaproteobacteria bacterium RIFCSPLOWO2_02_FULL_46_8]|nr:MAG: hypothetical protein A3H42_03410 [Deltaproteobacteria bacterium RIFCSPLOWO2_02_FULL_46_8]